MISQAEVNDLRAAVSPQAHGGGHGEPSLLITHTRRSNKYSCYEGQDCWVISDGRGYITATQDQFILLELIQMEARGGVGTVRELVTGVPKIIGEEPPATPEAIPTLEDLLG